MRGRVDGRDVGFGGAESAMQGCKQEATPMRVLSLCLLALHFIKAVLN